MSTFQELGLSRMVLNGLDDLGFEQPTPIQEQVFSTCMSGKDVVGIAQTGTGKTLAFMLPILQAHKYSEKKHPTVLIMVPTRELVLQMVERINEFAKYITIRVQGIYGGANINMQRQRLLQGADVIVATPGRLYDLAVERSLQLKSIKKLVIDEVDVMLDLGFIFQLTNIFELLPEQRQNLMFSATMTDEVEGLINDFFMQPKKVEIAVSGTPLDNIEQSCYPAKNFHTKKNLLIHLLQDREEFRKVVVFCASKKHADKLAELMEEEFGSQFGVVHSNKSQNFRINAITDFEEGKKRILITTDVMARGLDLDKISHVFNYDVPSFPENYMHRIGRTGRAEEKGKAVLFYTEKELPYVQAIEQLMDMKITKTKFPDEVTNSNELIADERPKDQQANYNRNDKNRISGEDRNKKKSEKNAKSNQGGSYRRKLAAKYKKPKTRGDKGKNKRK